MVKRSVHTDYIFIVLGSLVTALAFNLFLIPHKIAPGISGISTIIYYITKGRIPVGISMLS